MVLQAVTKQPLGTFAWILVCDQSESRPVTIGTPVPLVGFPLVRDLGTRQSHGAEGTRREGGKGEGGDPIIVLVTINSTKI